MKGRISITIACSKGYKAFSSVKAAKKYVTKNPTKKLVVRVA